MGFHRLGVVFSLAANSMFAFVVAGAELGMTTAIASIAIKNRPVSKRRRNFK
jgi:hypothetical protein